MSKGQSQKGKVTGEAEILTHEATLRLLSEMARNGSVTAAVALARELRLDPGEDEHDELEDELDRLMRRHP